MTRYLLFIHINDPSLQVILLTLTACLWVQEYHALVECSHQTCYHNHHSLLVCLVVSIVVEDCFDAQKQMHGLVSDTYWRDELS